MMGRRGVGRVHGTQPAPRLPMAVHMTEFSQQGGFIATSYPGNLSDVFWEAIRKKQFLSLYQGLNKNIQSFVSSFFSFIFMDIAIFKDYWEKSGAKSIGTSANLLVAAAAGACTIIDFGCY